MRASGRLSTKLSAEPPDALVIIDSPDFTHAVAKRVRKRLPRLPIIDYVSPSVWAWRPGRAARMRAYVDHVLALLPFEPEAHRRLKGPACTYVGHPLIERLDELRPDREEEAARHGHPPLVLALPGSRGGEIGRLTALFGAALALASARAGPLDIVVPTVAKHAARVAAAVAAWPLPARIVSEEVEKLAAFRRARAALAASGTVTLELALAGIPHVGAYRVPAAEAFLARRLIKVPTVLLPNLILGENAVPELLQDAASPQALADALVPLIVGGAASGAPARGVRTPRRADVARRRNAVRPGGAHRSGHDRGSARRPLNALSASGSSRCSRGVSRRYRAAAAGRSSATGPRSSPSTARSSRRCGRARRGP